jgi:hypothetical protein
VEAGAANSPEALAEYFNAESGALLQALSAETAKTQEADFHATAGSRAKAAAPRIFSAFYCLGMRILARTNLGTDRKQFDEHFGALRREWKRLQPDWKGPFTFESVLQQGVGLYLRDAPNLTELVRSKPDYVFEDEVHTVEKSDDWLDLFTLKAKIQVLEAMRIRTHEAAHIPCARLVDDSLRRVATDLQASRRG